MNQLLISNTTYYGTRLQKKQLQSVQYEMTGLREQSPAQGVELDIIRVINGLSPVPDRPFSHVPY